MSIIRFRYMLSFAVLLACLPATPVTVAYAKDSSTIVTSETPPPASNIPAIFNKRNFSATDIKELYKRNQNTPFWHNERGELTPFAKKTIAQLNDAWQDGLTPERYGTERLNNYLEKPDTFSSWFEADVFLSSALLFYLSDLQHGRARQDEKDPESFVLFPYQNSQKEFMAYIRNQTNIVLFLDTLRPTFPEYTLIRNALLEQHSDTMKTLEKRIMALKPSDIFIKKENTHPAIPALRDFLISEGFDVTSVEPLPEETKDNIAANNTEQDEIKDLLIVVDTKQENDEIVFEIDTEKTSKAALSENNEADEATAKDTPPPLSPALAKFYDTKTERAFRNYQHQHGLLVDGIIGPKSIEFIQSNFKDRIRKLSMTLERLRWYNEHYKKEKHILVNIPAYYTRTFDDNGDTAFFMDVIIGMGSRKTPEMISVIPSITFAPYWMVPTKNARENVLPHIHEDPNYYDEMGFELFQHVSGERVLIDASQFDWASIQPNQFPPFRFRQRPGPHNSLGPIRFNIINRQNIFLHGTSHPELFSRSDRNLSSGCVRLKDPWQMIKFITNNNSTFTESKLLSMYNNAIEGKEGFASYTIALDKKIPVHIVYWTSWVDDNNNVHYANDIYKRDKTLERIVNTKG